jgi:glycosyltransferase involved in cell wall biosynthesis
VVDGVNGYFIENSMDLAQKILMLYKDNKLLDTLSTNSRNMGLELYSKKAMINKYLVQIDEVLQSVSENCNSDAK